MAWNGVGGIGSKKYTCGFCGNIVASAIGFVNKNDGTTRIYICPHCDNPTLFKRDGSRFPGITPGNDVDNLPEDLRKLYKEARNSVSAGANTASVLACRKLLMNIAV